MAKKLISSDDLEWLILEEFMQDRGSRAFRPTIAIVPDPKRGWRAVVAPGSQRFMTEQRERELIAVQERLLSKYKLRR